MFIYLFNEFVYAFTILILKVFSGHRRSKALSLDISGGRSGVLLQVLPHVCSTTQTNSSKLAYLNAAVRALQQLSRRTTQNTQENESKAKKHLANKKLHELDEDASSKNAASLQRLSCQKQDNFCKKSSQNAETLLKSKDEDENFEVLRKNELNKETSKTKIAFKNQLININRDEIEGTNSVPVENDIFQSFSDFDSSCIDRHENKMSCLRSAIPSQHSPDPLNVKKTLQNDSLDFREELFSTREFFCM